MQVIADILTGHIVQQDNPFTKDEGRLWCNYDELRIECGGVMLRYRGQDIYKINVPEWAATDSLTIQGIEGRTEIRASI